MSARAQAQKERLFNMFMGIGGDLAVVHGQNRVRDQAYAIHIKCRETFANIFSSIIYRPKHSRRHLDVTKAEQTQGMVC